MTGLNFWLSDGHIWESTKLNIQYLKTHNRRKGHHKPFGNQPDHDEVPGLSGHNPVTEWSVWHGTVKECVAKVQLVAGWEIPKWVKPHAKRYPIYACRGDPSVPVHRQRHRQLGLGYPKPTRYGGPTVLCQIGALLYSTAAHSNDSMPGIHTSSTLLQTKLL